LVGPEAHGPRLVDKLHRHTGVRLPRRVLGRRYRAHPAPRRPAQIGQYRAGQALHFVGYAGVRRYLPAVIIGRGASAIEPALQDGGARLYPRVTRMTHAAAVTVRVVCDRPT
jgi:hypothetical protein